MNMCFNHLSLHMSVLQTYFQCLVILSDVSIWLINYFSSKHQNLPAMLEVVKILQNVSPTTNVVQSFRNLAEMMFRLCATKLMKQISQFQNRLAATANQIRPWSSQTGSKPILSNSLTYHSQTWYIDLWRHPGDTQIIWWPLTSGGRQTGISARLSCIQTKLASLS